MNPTCKGCPGVLMGDCPSCRVTRECHDRDDYEDTELGGDREDD